MWIMLNHYPQRTYNLNNLDIKKKIHQKNFNEVDLILKTYKNCNIVDFGYIINESSYLKTHSSDIDKIFKKYEFVYEVSIGLHYNLKIQYLKKICLY
jgi:hypothetical protein